MEFLNGKRLNPPASQGADGEPDEGFVEDLHAGLRRLTKGERNVLKADLKAGFTVPALELSRRFKTDTNSIHVLRSRGRSKLLAWMRESGYKIS